MDSLDYATLLTLLFEVDNAHMASYTMVGLFYTLVTILKVELCCNAWQFVLNGWFVPRETIQLFTCEHSTPQSIATAQTVHM